MLEYIDASGQIYTEDQINKMAAEQKTSANAIIKSKGLTANKRKERSSGELLEKFGNTGSSSSDKYKGVKQKSFSGVTEKGAFVPDQDPGYASRKKEISKSIGNVEGFDKKSIGRVSNIDLSKFKKNTAKEEPIESLKLEKPGDYLVSTLADDSDMDRIFKAEEEEGVDYLRTLYRDIPGLTFEETNFGTGAKGISNLFDAVKAVYIDPNTGKRVESKPIAFDIGILNTGDDEKSEKLNANKKILNDFFNENLKNVDLGKNKHTRNKLAKITNMYVDSELTPEVIKGIEDKYAAPDLFEAKVVTKPQPKIYAKEADPNAVYTETVLPYKTELRQAEKEILASNPKISKQDLLKESEQLARQILVQKDISNKRGTIIEKLIDKDSSLQSTLLVGASVEKSEAVKKQNKLSVEISGAIASTYSANDAKSILNKALTGFEYTSAEEKKLLKSLSKLNIPVDPMDNAPVKLSNGAIVPKWMYDSAEPLQKKDMAQVAVNNTLFKEQNANLAKLEKTATFAEAAAKNYDLAEKYTATFATGVGELLLDTGYLMAKSNTLLVPSQTLDYIAIEGTNKLNRVRESYVRDVAFEDAFNDVGNFSKFMAQEVSTQLPILLGIVATGGGAGSSAFIGASSAGNKMAQMQSEVANGEADYSDANIWLSSLAYGGAEMLFESVTTLPILKSAKINFGAKYGEDIVDNGLRAYFKTKTPGFIADSLLESAGETGTTITQNAVDGKPLLENVDHSAFSGFAMGTVLSGVPYLRGAYLSSFSTYSDKKNIRDLQSKIAKLSNDYEAAPNKKTADIIMSEIDKTSTELANQIDSHEVLIGNNLRSGAAESVIAIESRKAQLQNEAKEILNDKEIPATLKDKKIDELRSEFNKLQSQKESIVKPRNLMSGFSDLAALETSDPGLYEEIKNQAISNLQKNTAEPSVDQINRESYDIFLKGKIDKNIEQVSKNEGANVIAFDSKKEALDWVALTYDAKVADIENNTGIDDNIKAQNIEALKIEKKEIEDELRLGADGFKIDEGQILVKENMFQNQHSEIGSHEVGHYAFDLIFSTDPKAFIPIAKQLLDTTKKLDKKIYDKIIKTTERLSNGELKADEVIMRFIEYVSDNKLNFADKAGGLAGLFGTMVQKEFVDKYDFDFKGQTDMFNFVVGLGKKIKAGTLTLSDIQGARESAVFKIATETGSKRVEGIGMEEGTTGFSKSIEERMDELDRRLNDNEIDIDLYDDLMEALEKEEADLARKEYEEKKSEVKKPAEKKAETKPTKAKEDAEVSEIANKAKAKLDAIGNDPKGFNPNNPTIYTELDKMVKAKSRNWKTAKGTIIDLTNKDKGGIDGFDLEQMTSYVTTSMIPYIAKFDPSRNNSLYGYINAQYINRMKGALKSGEVADVVFAEDVSEMTKLSNEEVETKTPSLPERKRFQNILESGVFAPEVIEDIQKKILPIIRTLKSSINEKTSLNRTVAPLIEEIRDEMGKQADIDIKKAMGGKEGGQLVKWLIANKKTVLENAPTTWLMGKDNGKVVLGGMPFAIQKRVDGRWLNYPDWVGKKVDRESVNVDLAGRTAGHEMTRRLPDVAKNVPNDVFIESIVDPITKGPIRGRKESLAKMMAEEISFDIISDDIANGGLIAEALNRNQELKGAITEDVSVELFNKMADRGNVKFSLVREYNKAIADAGKYNKLSKEEKSRTIDPYSDKNSLINKFLRKIYRKSNDDNPEIVKFRAILDQKIRTKKGLYWKMHETVIGKRIDKFNTYKVTNYGGNNPNVADIIIAKTAKIVKNINKVFVESKKAADALIPITSATANVIINKFKNKDTFDKLSKKSQDAIEKIVELQKGLKDKFNLSSSANVTEAGNIKLVGDNLVNVKNELGSRRKRVESVPVGIDLVKLFNDKKFHPNDVIVIGERAFDYFKGYTGFDTFDNIFEKYKIDDLENNLFVINAEYQINSEGNLTIRTYLNFNEAIKTADGNIINGIDVINAYIKDKGSNLDSFNDTNINNIIAIKSNKAFSKSLETNLDSFKGINNIDLVSKYISNNNVKRISAEDSFDVLNALVKEVENYWGVVPDNVITLMDRSIDYAFDVIENRENEGGPMMAAVNGALNLETVKNAEVQLNKFIDNNKISTPKFSKSLDYEFNDMLERNKKIPSYEKISDIVAKRKGKKVRSLSFFVPPSADDFRGLTTYMFAGSGKQGEADQQFFDSNLVIPYVKGVNALDSVRQSIKNEYKKLLGNFPEIKGKLEKLTPDKQFTYDQAVRVYLWNKNDIEVPGLDRKGKNRLVFLVKNDPDLMAFANALSMAGRQDGGWMKPSVTWDSETIISDLHNITEGEGRKKWLSEFIENAEAIFTPENLNKIQFIYGTDVRNQIEDSLYRMKNGKNRPEGTDAITNKWMNWINGSTSAIMFFNTRSALLQTISSTNYLNWNDNNPIAAAAAFANQKQYWSDFATIINSDKMRERRSGLKSDVTQAEIANAANSATDKAKGILSYLQKIGFTPTQAADSFSIAIGGASFYRNRVNTYLKQVDEDGNKVNTLEEAEEKAWLDFSVITDQSMQSADPMYVSKQQTTALGRLVLAFANTPLQYNRQIKKATLDLVNKRGDWKTNISKIVYYGALQNLLFSALQSALFLPFDEEDEEAIAEMSKEEKKAYDKLVKKQEDKTKNILNGMLDTVLRGSGVYGALVSTIKNVGMEYQKQEERKNFADHAQTLLALASISPPISSKARKLYGIHRTNKFEKDVIDKRGWEVTNDGRLNLSPKYTMVGNAVMATTNVPLDRIVEKVENISEVLDNRNTVVQRTALFLGWKEWELNVKNEENEKIKTEAKENRKKEGTEKAIKTRKKKKADKEKEISNMSLSEREAYYDKERAEKLRKRLERRKKRRMGGD